MVLSSSLLPLCLIATINAFAPARKSVLNFAPTRSPHIITGRFDRHRTVSIAADKSNETVEIMPSTPNTNTNELIIDQLVTLVGKSASSLVSISFFLLLATRRDAVTLTLFIGSIFNAVTSKVLKKLLNHERPANLQLNENVKLKPSDGGMVSMQCIRVCSFSCVSRK